MKPDRAAIRRWKDGLPEASRDHTLEAARAIADAKQRGGKVVVVTGSGPNIHEGVTTLLAELIYRGIVDGVLTSSAVVAHEMAGTLDRVKRVKIPLEGFPGIDSRILPRGRVFEATLLTPEERLALEEWSAGGWDLYDRLLAAEGSEIIKAAGNMAWPLGPRTEALAREAETIARSTGSTVEHIAGLGADPRTMIGAGARRNVPVLVSVPQLVGGGEVGLAIGDAISITDRCRRIAALLAEADVIVESAIALAQEIHDGPFELHTGHGIWSAWQNRPVYSLENKRLIRIDLDPNLEKAWAQERSGSSVQAAVDRGLPKTKTTGMPFRMEMSGFARLAGSLPITGDIGVVWPVLAARLEDDLRLDFDFISAPQETEEGRRMREWIVRAVKFVDRAAMREGAGMAQRA